MQFEDTTRIDTPEGVELALTLAGLGSRIVAQLTDGLIKGGSSLLLVLVLGTDSVATSVAIAAITLLMFFGYETVFEILWSGRTPGKRSAGIRVVMADGSPVTFMAAVVRGLLRIVDFLPGLYGVGAVLVFSTKKNQRLGDMAAGTIVIRERKVDQWRVTVALDNVSIPPGFDATGVKQEQLALARSYLLRRSSLTLDVRNRLAAQIAAELRPVVMDPTGQALRMTSSSRWSLR